MSCPGCFSTPRRQGHQGLWQVRTEVPEPGLFPLLLPHTHIPCSCNVPAYTLELASRKLAGARKQVWCRLFPSWSSEGATETLGVAIWFLTPLSLPHKCTGTAPQPASTQPLLRLQPGSEGSMRIWKNCMSSRCQLGDIWGRSLSCSHSQRQ